jgi:hypothetical protein
MLKASGSKFLPWRSTVDIAGTGRTVLAEAKTRIAAAPHDGQVIAGLVHPDNTQSCSVPWPSIWWALVA